jgi:hypothetical protein
VRRNDRSGATTARRVYVCAAGAVLLVSAIDFGR